MNPELKQEFDKLWTTLDTINVNLAVVRTIVENDHEHRLQKIEKLQWWLITTALISLLGIAIKVFGGH